MSLSEFLKNLSFDNDYFKQVELLTKEKYSRLVKSLKDNSLFSDYSREFGHFTIYSLINLEKNTSNVKTFIPARKQNNYLYTWNNKKIFNWSRVPLKLGQQFFIFYNEFGKPYKAFLEDKIVDSIGYNGIQDAEAPVAYSENISTQDVANAKNGYFIFFEIFENQPFKIKYFENVNFIFHGNSPLLDKKEIIHWAKLNGAQHISNKTKSGFVNVAVNLSDFPFTPKSLLNSKIPVGLKNNTIKISYKDFINIAYNISYKENYNFTWDKLIKERVLFLEENLSYFLNNKNNTKHKRYREQVIKELKAAIDELNSFNF